ncbi:DNA-binding transcriptional LysR family regulator [Flavobacterium nitrogenifigens]|uniref:DNA-binding transcriptional LysR family regulator n=2 Tax=Flavobacterium TaxID=237 RepID=A0A7W7J093_9FLAO|nr:MULTISPECIES: LysR family transcriptional regulator [Flavobacterium]MBB4803871.1 DNA-binding transcriptional LysR family regulator [Flavobacterium nitrogenifigens]MBB6388977.1 DNA-binding transcriptional LysR family regulator [Flavobacterium notoginsengisoli]
MDFRLKVFYTVALRLNFTKAATELYITQPAVSKHIQELEETYKTKLFERNGSKIALTPAGKILLKYTKSIFDLYREIDFEMSSFNKERQGLLRLGASTTISQYIISPILASFHQKQKDIKVNLLNGNTEQIENALINKEIEIGIVEGQSKNQSIKYIPFLKDELVLVCNSKNPFVKQDEISINDLKSMKFITRERGSGTLEVIEFALKKAGLKFTDLQIEMQLGSTESIKSYLLNSDCFAFMSIHAVSKELKNKELIVLDVEELSIERYFYIITLQGKSDSLSELFIQNMANHYNLKL